MLIWAGFSLLFFLLFNKDYIYSASSVFPQKVRRGWIKWVYGEDFAQWDNFRNILENHFPYYKTLTEKEKSEFLVRLIDFKNRLPIEGRDGLEIDTKKSVLLNASLAQITFGFSDFRFRDFARIIVYPEIFYSKYLDADVKGVTYSTGYIFLSWKDFEEGYEDYTNKINLGLHEFAHALMLEKDDRFEGTAFEEFEQMVQYLTREKASQTGENELFRDYGFRNINEFWAVSVEVFFEQPIQFKETYPNMYKIMAYLLKQDMADRLERYETADRFGGNRISEELTDPNSIA